MSKLTKPFYSLLNISEIILNNISRGTRVTYPVSNNIWQPLLLGYFRHQLIRSRNGRNLTYKEVKVLSKKRILFSFQNSCKYPSSVKVKHCRWIQLKNSIYFNCKTTIRGICGMLRIEIGSFNIDTILNLISNFCTIIPNICKKRFWRK